MLSGLFVLLRNPTAAGSKFGGTGLPGGITLENSAEGGRRLDLVLWYFTRKIARHPINPIPITPPTVPPTIAPVLALDEPPLSPVEVAELVEVDELDEVEEEMEEGGELVEEEEGIEVAPGAVDSGWLTSSSAIVALKRSAATMLIYAQPGTAVALGMARG